MWNDLNAGSSTSYTQRPVWMEEKLGGSAEARRRGMTHKAKLDAPLARSVITRNQIGEHNAQSRAACRARRTSCDHTTQRSTHPNKSRPHVSTHYMQLAWACTPHRHAGACVQGGRPDKREGRDITLRLEVWQLRHDWVVLLRRRLRWSMSMEKSRSRRSPFMTCVCADSANMAGTDGAGGGGATTTTTTTATRRTRGGSVLAQGTE